jgi:hypothetical protein
MALTYGSLLATKLADRVRRLLTKTDPHDSAAFFGTVRDLTHVATAQSADLLHELWHGCTAEERDMMFLYLSDGNELPLNLLSHCVDLCIDDIPYNEAPVSIREPVTLMDSRTWLDADVADVVGVVADVVGNAADVVGNAADVVGNAADVVGNAADADLSTDTVEHELKAAREMYWVNICLKTLCTRLEFEMDAIRAGAMRQVIMQVLLRQDTVDMPLPFESDAKMRDCVHRFTTLMWQLLDRRGNLAGLSCETLSNLLSLTRAFEAVRVKTNDDCPTVRGNSAVMRGCLRIAGARCAAVPVVVRLEAMQGGVPTTELMKSWFKNPNIDVLQDVLTGIAELPDRWLARLCYTAGYLIGGYAQANRGSEIARQLVKQNRDCILERALLRMLMTIRNVVTWIDVTKTHTTEQDRNNAMADHLASEDRARTDVIDRIIAGNGARMLKEMCYMTGLLLAMAWDGSKGAVMASIFWTFLDVLPTIRAMYTGFEPLFLNEMGMFGTLRMYLELCTPAELEAVTGNSTYMADYLAAHRRVSPTPSAGVEDTITGRRTLHSILMPNMGDTVISRETFLTSWLQKATGKPVNMFTNEVLDRLPGNLSMTSDVVPVILAFNGVVGYTELPVALDR